METKVTKTNGITPTNPTIEYISEIPNEDQKEIEISENKKKESPTKEPKVTNGITSNEIQKEDPKIEISNEKKSPVEHISEKEPLIMDHISEKEPPMIEYISEKLPNDNKKEDPSPPTSGIGDDSSPETPSSPYSLASSIDDKDPKKLSIEITENPNYEVKFSGLEDIDKDSIMSSSSSSLSSSDDESKKPKIPDGGWGWMVVLASLILSMIADGISFSFGLLYVEFLKEFGESKSKTAWIGSLFMAVPLLAGPVASALVDRYGCRLMTIVGGLISATGFVLSAYVHSIELMYLTFGVIAGLGLGLCYVTAVVSIAYWFDKKRNLAVGLGACGTGVGTFVYAPMTQFFIDEYAWRGTTLLLAGTFLNMCVCGCLMRAPEWWTIEQNRNNSVAGSKSLRNASSCGSVSGRSDITNFPGAEEIRNLLKSGQSPEYILTTLTTTVETPQEEEIKQPNHCRSVVNLPTFVNQSEKVPFEVLKTLSENKRIYNIILENYPSLLMARSTSDRGLNKIAEDAGFVNRVPLKMSMKIKRAAKSPPVTNGQAPPPYTRKYLPHQQSMPEDPSAMPLLDSNNTNAVIVPMKKKPPALPRSDSMPWLRRQFSVHNPNTNYLKHIRLHRNSVMYRGAMLNITKYRMRASSCPNIYKNSMTTLAKENQEKWYADVLDMIKGMCDFSMLLEFHFLLIAITTILLFTWFIVPYFYLTEHLSRYGYSEAESSKLISIIGVTNTIGMVGLGWAGDQPWMNVQKTYGVCLILCGISTIGMMVFTTNHVMLVISCCSFGLFFASNFTFTPVILVELMPLERFTTAYGLILLCQGIGNLLGPPLAGLLFDITGAWDQSFTHAGIWIVLAGVLLLIVPYTENRKIYGTGPLEKDMDRDSIA